MKAIFLCTNVPCNTKCINVMRYFVYIENDTELPVTCRSYFKKSYKQ